MGIKRSFLILLVFHNLRGIFSAKSILFECNKAEPKEESKPLSRPASVTFNSPQYPFSPGAFSPGALDTAYYLSSNFEFSSDYFQSKSGTNINSVAAAFRAVGLDSIKAYFSTGDKLSSSLSSDIYALDFAFDLDSFIASHKHYEDSDVFTNPELTSALFTLVKNRNAELPILSQTGQLVIMRAIVFALLLKDIEVYKNLCAYLFMHHIDSSSLVIFKQSFIGILFDNSVDINYFSTFIEDTLNLWVRIEGLAKTMESFVKAFSENHLPVPIFDKLIDLFVAIFSSSSDIKIPTFDVKSGTESFSFFSIFYNHVCKKNYLEIAFRLTRNVESFVDNMKKPDVLYMLSSAEFIKNDGLFREIIQKFFESSSAYRIDPILVARFEYLSPLELGLKTHLPCITSLKFNPAVQPRIENVPILINIFTNAEFTLEHLIAHFFKTKSIPCLSQFAEAIEKKGGQRIDIPKLNSLLLDFDLFSIVEMTLKFIPAFSLLSVLLNHRFADNLGDFYNAIIRCIETIDEDRIRNGTFISIARMAPNLKDLLQISLIQRNARVAEIICAYFRIEDSSFAELQSNVAMLRGTFFTEIVSGFMIELSDERNQYFGIPFILLK